MILSKVRESDFTLTEQFCSFILVVLANSCLPLQIVVCVLFVCLFVFFAVIGQKKPGLLSRPIRSQDELPVGHTWRFPALSLT